MAVGIYVRGVAAVRPYGQAVMDIENILTGAGATGVTALGTQSAYEFRSGRWGCCALVSGPQFEPEKQSVYDIFISIIGSAAICREDSNLVRAITSGIAQLGGLEAHVGKLPGFPNALFNAVHEPVPTGRS